VEADAHFTVPRRVEGAVDLGGWLHTELACPLQAPIQVLITELLINYRINVVN